MTSAYGGIRWESGLARLFQYEKTQSRIGGSLWEKRDLLHRELGALLRRPGHDAAAHRARRRGRRGAVVPGDRAVPRACAGWGRDCILLQYRGEPHHLRKYPNKLDYSIKMKQYFDHYLKGEPAADWITNGVPYRGK